MSQGRLILVCLLLCLHRVQGIRIELDEPHTKYVHLGSKTSIRCLVTYERHHLSVNSVQIVRSQTGQQTVLSKGARIFESESQYYKVAKLDFNRTRTLKLETNQTQPLKLDTNQTQPLKLDTNQTQPLKLDTNQTQPLKLDTNQTQPLKMDTNQTQPLKLDTNQTQPLKMDTNQTQPLKMELVFEILSARTVDNAEFKCRYVDHRGNVQAEDGVKLLIVRTPRIDSFTANKRREYLEVTRDSGIEFKCLASGVPTVSLSLLKSTPDGKDEFVHISRHRNRLEFEIDHAECRHGGVYRCQIDKNPRSAKKVTAVVNKCGSGEMDSDKSTHSKHLAIKVAIPCVCAAVIAFGVVAIINYVKRCKSHRTKSTFRVPGIQMSEAVYSDNQEVYGLSPPPYSICQNVVDMGVPPPVYPGEGATCDQNKTKQTVRSRASDKVRTDPSKAGQLHTDAHIDDLPPPYTTT